MDAVFSTVLQYSSVDAIIVPSTHREGRVHFLAWAAYCHATVESCRSHEHWLENRWCCGPFQPSKFLAVATRTNVCILPVLQDLDSAQRVAHWLCDFFSWASSQPRPLAWAASCRTAAAVLPALRRPGAFESELKLPAVGAAGRVAMLTAGIRRRGWGVEGGPQMLQVRGWQPG